MQTIAGMPGAHRIYGLNKFDYRELIGFIMVNPCDPSRPICLLSDPTHIVKKARNNWSKSGVGKKPSSKAMELVTSDGRFNGAQISWQHLIDCYVWDMDNSPSVCGLTEDSVFLNCFSRMREGHATRVMNPRVIGGTTICCRGEEIDETVHHFSGMTRSPGGEG